MTKNVKYMRHDVIEMLPRWKKVRDCIAGENALKKGGVAYLPHPAGYSQDTRDQDRFAAYVERAVYVNMTGRTLRGLVGQVFSKPPVLTLPTQLEGMVDNVDGGAMQFDQQSKAVLGDVLAVGRVALVADWSAERNMPTVQVYRAENVINWRVGTVAGSRQLTLLVLKEDYDDEDDGFGVTVKSRYREFRLVDAQAPEMDANDLTETIACRCRLWDEDGAGNVGEAVEVEMLDFSGTPLEEIPAVVVGSESNDPAICPPPMEDIALLNLAHFRNSADFEELVFLVGQPTPYFAGLTQTWVDTNFANGKVVLGSRNAIPLPQGGTAGLLQVSESQIAMKAMEHKERQLVALGAKLVESKQVQRTATEARAEEASEASVLMAAADNVSAAYTRVLRWCAAYAMGSVPSGIAYELDTDFEISRMTPDARRQLLEEWKAGAISFTEYRSILRRAGVATQEDEVAKEEIDEDAASASALMMGAMGGSPPGSANPIADDGNVPEEEVA